MRKGDVLFIVLLLIETIFIYLGVGFILMNLNVAEWGMIGRGALVVLIAANTVYSVKSRE